MYKSMTEWYFKYLFLVIGMGEALRSANISAVAINSTGHQGNFGKAKKFIILNGNTLLNIELFYHL